jgi:hypothetical protein
MLTAKKLILEMPINTGDFQDFIHPSHKQRIAAHSNPAMPERHAELLASKSYQAAMTRLARYTGVNPRSQGDMMRLSMMLFQALQSVAQIEGGHEEQLEHLSVQLVLNLPEFASAKQAVEAGDLRVIASMRPDIDLDGAQMDAQDTTDKEELQIAQVALELDLEAKKRAFINMLIQGNAMNKLQAYHMATEELNAIDPRLLNLYGILTSVGELGYWIYPEAMQQQGMGGGGGGQAGGAARVRTGPDGVPEIHAQGITFPMLVHELVKGLMEYLSFNEDDEASTRQFAQGQADTLTNELLDQKIGPAAWKDIVALINDQHMIPYVYDFLVRLPATQFNETVRTLMQGGNRAQQLMQQIVQKVSPQEESMGGFIARNLLD